MGAPTTVTPLLAFGVRDSTSCLHCFKPLAASNIAELDPARGSLASPSEPFPGGSLGRTISPQWWPPRMLPGAWPDFPPSLTTPRGHHRQTGPQRKDLGWKCHNPAPRFHPAQPPPPPHTCPCREPLLWLGTLSQGGPTLPWSQPHPGSHNHDPVQSLPLVLGQRYRRPRTLARVALCCDRSQLYCHLWTGPGGPGAPA